MVSSIRLTGCHKVKVSSNKIKINDTVLNIDKEIPFVRYKFSAYGENEIAYIKKMKEQFNKSTHLVEIELTSETANIIETLRNDIGNIAIYVYMDITDTEVSNRSLSAGAIVNINSLVGLTVDRYMLVDKSTTLDLVTAKEIIKHLAKMQRLPESTYGICSSPLSFGELACLTAVKAREIMSKYSEISDVVLPSANHQCLTSCGCIRFITISGDTDEISDNKKHNTSNKAKSKADSSNSSDKDDNSTGEKEKSSKKSKQHKKTKNGIMPGLYNL